MKTELIPVDWWYEEISFFLTNFYVNAGMTTREQKTFSRAEKAMEAVLVKDFIQEFSRKHKDLKPEEISVKFVYQKGKPFIKVTIK